MINILNYYHNYLLCVIFKNILRRTNLPLQVNVLIAVSDNDVYTAAGFYKNDILRYPARKWSFT